MDGQTVQRPTDPSAANPGWRTRAQSGLGRVGVATGAAIVLLLAVLAAVPSAGAVLSLEELTVETGDTVLSTTSFTHQVPDGEDRLLLVSASWDDANDVTFSSVTYAGNDLTCLDPAKRTPKVGSQMCYLLAPPTGSNTLDLSWSADVGEWAIVARSLTDVDQDQPLGATSLASGNGSSASDTLTTEEPDSVVFAHVGAENADISLDAAGDTVEDAETTAGLSSLGISAAAGRVNTTTAGEHTIGWNLSSAEAWALVPAEIRRSPEQVSFHQKNQSIDEPSSPVSVQIDMDRESSGDVKVDYEWTGGNASSDDHDLSAGTAVVPSGKTTTTLSFNVTDDDAEEPDETIEITLKNPRGGETASPTTHLLTIVDDDENSAPQPETFSLTTEEDTDISDQVTATDPDQNDTVDSYDVDTSPDHGSLTFDTATGEFSYSPDADWNGEDAFTFTATDEHGLTSANETVDITVAPVDDAPVAEDDAATVDEDETVWIDVLANDTDVDDDTLSIATVSDPADGSTSLPGNGTVAFTPEADWNGETSFSYDVTDGSLTDTGTVNVAVEAVNDAPVAEDDAATVDEDETVWIDVLANDTDVEGDALSIASVSPPSDGNASLPGNGTVEYTPDPGFTGEDAFSYDVSDGSLTDVAGVSLTVDPASGPQVLSSTVRVLEGDLEATPTLRTETAASTISLQLENASDGLELAELNATTETIFEINLTTEGFDAAVLVGRSQVVDWTNTTNDDGTQNVSLQLQPISMAFIHDCETYDPFMGYCGPASVDAWPTTLSDDQANVSFEAGLRVALSDLAYMDEDTRENLEGGSMTTDAQALGQMNVTPGDASEPAAIQIPVAGPHTLPDGAQNEGFFEARIPEAMLDSWGLNDTGALAGTYQGDNRSITITDVEGAILVEMDIHYSAGNVTIGEDTRDPEADAGEDVTVTEGQSLTLDAGNATDNQGIANHTWTLGDGTTAYGETIEHTYAEAGVYPVTLNVTDGAGNSDEDTVNVTVQAASSAGGGGGGGGSSNLDDDGDEAAEAETEDETTDGGGGGNETEAEVTTSSGSGPQGSGDAGTDDPMADASLGPRPASPSDPDPASADEEADGDGRAGSTASRVAEQGVEIGAWLVWLLLVPISILGIRRHA